MVSPLSQLSRRTLNIIKAALLNGEPVRSIMASTGISKSRIYTFRSNLVDYGSMKPFPNAKPGPPSKVDDEAFDVCVPSNFRYDLTRAQGIVDYLLQYHATATVQEVRDFVEKEYALDCHPSTILRAIKKA